MKEVGQTKTQESVVTPDVASVKVEKASPRALTLYADELANLFAGITVIAIAFLFLLLISFVFGFLPYFPAFLIAGLIVAAAASFFVLIYFVDQADQQQRREETEAAYVVNKWRISTMSAIGMPEDIVTGLKTLLLQNRNQGQNLQLVMKKPFGVDAWIYRLGDLLGEERVVQYEEQLLRHTKTKIES
ncbi:MAG: SUR7/PalI family protein [Acidobacteriota bacterium]|nr:SUR7/PalI family protein [Acidobacteriota bacterium]